MAYINNLGQVRIGVRGWVAAQSGASVTDSDATAFVTAAGITDSTQISALNTLVTDLKTYGLWTKMKALYPFVGGSAASHKFNLKDPRDLDAAYRLVFNGGWVHSSTGALPNGTTAFADTKLNATILTKSSTHLSFYSKTNNPTIASTGRVDIGCQIGALTSMFMGISDYGGYNVSMYVNSGNYISSTNPTDTRGFMLSTVQSLTSLKSFWYQSGGSFTQKGSTITTVSGDLPNNNIYISRNGSSTSSYEFSNRESVFASIGDGLTDTEALNFYISVQKFQTTIGRHVGTPYVSDPDAIAFLMAAGITDGTQAAAINTLVIRMKADGVWTKMKAIYPFVGGSATSHKFNLKDPRDLDAAFRLVFNGGWTHTGTGAKPNGTTGYANTYLNPKNNLGVNSGLGVYSRTNDTSKNQADMGAMYYFPVQAFIIGSGTSLGIFMGSNSSDFISFADSDTRAFYQVYRTNSTTVKSLRNTTSYSNTNLPYSAPNLNVFIGARNEMGIAQDFGLREVAFAYMQENFTDVDALNLYSAVQSFQTTLGRQVNVPLVSDTDAQAFLNAANITSFQQAAAVNKLVVDLKAAGVWTKMKAIYPFVGGSAASHKFNLKDPRDLDAAFRLVFNGGWTHTGTGALPNGTTGYADTKMNANSTNFDYQSMSATFYSRTNNSLAVNDIGVQTGSNRRFIELNIKEGNLSYMALSHQGISYLNFTNNDSRGFYHSNRIDSNTIKLYKNGTNVATGTQTSTDIYGEYSVYISALNARHNNNQVLYFSNREVSFTTLGSGLTDAEATSLYNAVQTYQTSLGRAVDTPVYNNGLVLNLDAGNANSYPGTGTTWFDLASGKNATLLNGPVYNSNNGGYLSLDGVNDRIDTTYTPGTFTNQTIIAWINKTNTQYCFILQKNSSPPFGFEIYPTTIYVSYGAFEAYTGYNPTGWHQVAYVYDGTQTGNSNRVKVYLNGVLQNLTFGSNPPSSITINDVMQVGWRPWASLYSAVGISTLQMYNTSLSATEILNNFNSTRGRFGL